MLRNRFERRFFYSKLSFSYLTPFYRNYHIEKKYPFDFSKIKKRNTLYTEECMEGLNVADGVYVDIFPIDATFKNKFKHQGKILSFWRNVRWTKLRYKLQPFKKKLVTFPFTIFSLNFINKLAEKTMLKYSNKKTSEVSQICHPGPTTPCEPESFFLDTIDITFEGVSFKCPREYDLFLKHIYGDYMTMPPEDKRQPTHGILKVKL